MWLIDSENRRTWIVVNTHWTALHVTLLVVRSRYRMFHVRPDTTDTVAQSSELGSERSDGSLSKPSVLAFCIIKAPLDLKFFAKKNLGSFDEHPCPFDFTEVPVRSLQSCWMYHLPVLVGYLKGRMIIRARIGHPIRRENTTKHRGPGELQNHA